MLVELSKTSRWKIARESAPSMSANVEGKAERLQRKKQISKQRVAERERRRLALRERAHERDEARRQKLTCVSLREEGHFLSSVVGCCWRSDVLLCRLREDGA